MKKSFFYFLIFSMIASSAIADEVEAVSSNSSDSRSLYPLHEFLLSSSNINFRVDQGDGYSDNTLDIDLGYNKSANQVLQIGGVVAVNYYHFNRRAPDNSKQYYNQTEFAFKIGPTFNFKTDTGLDNAYFLRVWWQTGISLTKNASHRTEPNLQLVFGKRLKIIEHVSLTPNLYVIVSRSPDEKSNIPSFGFKLLSASIIW